MLLHFHPVYSVDLTVGLRKEGTKIPQVVRDCVHAVEHAGMEVQGIYRVSGARDDIYTIKADFDSGTELQKSLFHTHDVVENLY